MDVECTRYGFRCCSMPIDPVIELPEDPLKLETVYTTQHHVWSDEDRPIVPLCHHGQRKLLFAELHFFTKCCEIQGNSSVTKISGTVLYAGAASGIHIPILAEMLPKLEWILFDPNPFDPTVLSHPRCICIKTKFDVRSAIKEIKNSKGPIWFISDIRSTNSDEDVVKDMKLQSSWVRELKPTLASLKFRLPFSDLGYMRSKQASKLKNDRLVDYIGGDLYGQINAPAYSSEARLYTDATKPDVTYSVLKYESRLQGYNYFTRNMRFIVPYRHREVVMCVPGYDNGFESMTELSLLPENDIDYVVNFEKRMLDATKRHLSICAVSHPHDKSYISKGFASKCALQSLSRKSFLLRNIIIDLDTRAWILKEIDVCKRLLYNGKIYEQEGGKPKSKIIRKYIEETYDNHKIKIQDKKILDDNVYVEKEDTLERLLDNYDVINSLYRRNSVRIEDYDNRLKDMHLTTNSKISATVGPPKETQISFVSTPETPLDIPRYYFLPAEQAPDLNINSRVLIIAPNLILSQRILCVTDVHIHIIGMSGKWFRNMNDISSFLQKNKKTTFQWGGLWTDSWVLNSIKDLDKYDYVLIDTGADLDCTETIKAIDSMTSKFKNDVCINVFCWHPRTCSALAAMRNLSETYNKCTVTTNWYSPVLIKHFQTHREATQLLGAHIFWGGRSIEKKDLRPSHNKIGYKFDNAILTELDNRKEAIEKAYWYFLSQEPNSIQITNRGGSGGGIYLSQVAAFGVLTIVSMISLLRPMHIY